MANEKKTVREPSFILALIPIVAMIGFMLYCFRGHSESGYHDAHMPLVLSIVVACIVGAICGHSFKEMLAGMIERLAASMEAARRSTIPASISWKEWPQMKPTMQATMMDMTRGRCAS